jgi:hypothetical protein
MQAVSILVFEEAVAFDADLPDIHRYHVEMFNHLIDARPTEWLPDDEEVADEEPGADIIDMAAHIEMVNRMMT